MKDDLITTSQGSNPMTMTQPSSLPLDEEPRPSESPAVIQVVSVVKHFGEATAIDDVTLDILEGEFFSILGSSGCGKTTLLRMIAGFVAPDRGRVMVGDLDVTSLPPNRRPVNMMFQHYALFPHMTVEQNIEFGPKIARLPRRERKSRVSSAIKTMQLEGMERRRPAQLSGGQQQRVALARALVAKPRALLLDEPLGALDVKLRRDMQAELKRIQREAGTTFVYVTHDQHEALAMSDRIAVMKAGQVEQVGTPNHIYRQPISEFVADFVGKLNSFTARFERTPRGSLAARLSSSDNITTACQDSLATAGNEVRVGVRPEAIRLGQPSDGPDRDLESHVMAKVETVTFLGDSAEVELKTTCGSLLAKLPASEHIPSVGAEVAASWRPAETLIFDIHTGRHLI